MSQFNVDTNLITLTRHMIHEQKQHPNAKGDFTLVLASIQLGCKFVTSLVRRAGIAKLNGTAGTADTNASGETQKKLDVLADEIFINALASSGKVAVMVSEEQEKAIVYEDGRGPYIVVFDPLDGSSNIDAGVSIGTIFGVYQLHDGEKPSEEAALRPGRELVCGGYCMYGSSTNLVLSFGNGVHGYTLDPTLGEFVLTHENIRIPSRGKIYSINEGNSIYWEKQTSQWVNGVKNPEKGKSPYSLRYIGSMVADIHRTLLYGGVFLYPGDSKSPKGKLRVLYEVFPMSFLIEAAGGRASNGKHSALDIVPKSIHERSPVFLGSKEDIEDIEKLA
ncbi:fructose-1-6-bisphosphatase [Capsaspora owczarzaki ATCC 30864]|uniref:fructose-bisphosphatase n=1 Tax=Capsaspora owczarzaki (strain ATCC 30864) TaxID=595528 RepID=A0A0D2WNK8_CAPO3|nr:fructose-1-6-bisphosphatase [Capsaspora owczarzaki ATCC 30864]KJE92735.1 fructose-1-6-bisphosphatase [Capsaspora owczarzaki ATCC 30864]|eukprot:XP_004363373.1 fructose-1-6-bisphosphatase [Capsaspora owczarzaki ATCC 30864]